MQSTNWSGYLLQTAAGGTTDVQATWTVPTLNCSDTPNGDVAQWIGVDGVTNTDLFQTGTDSTCSSGVQSNTAWVEELPFAAQALPDALGTGDVVTAHIWQYQPSLWEFSLTDYTAGWQETSTPTSYTGPETSAEWINEDPTNGTTSNLNPFANFGQVTFSNISANLAVPNLTEQLNGVEMVQNNAVLSLPSMPTGSSFSVTYQ